MWFSCALAVKKKKRKARHLVRLEIFQQMRLALLAYALRCHLAMATAPDAKPNILFALVDDL
jgi:hypothetical protein